MRLLFVTWDGPGTTYHEALFVPLLERSVSEGDQVGLLQFSWGADARVERLAEFAAAKGMRFEHRRIPRGRAIWRAPFTLLAALWWMLRRTRDGTYDTVMARSMIPGGLTVLVRLLTRGGFGFIFDADGLPADERVEFGGWSRHGVRYRSFRLLERAAVRRSDAVIARTSRAVAILRERSGCSDERFVVVVNGKDPEQFHPLSEQERIQVRTQLGLSAGAPLLVYVGSIGPQYEPRFMLELLAQVLARAPDSRLLVLTSQLHHGALRAMADNAINGRLLLLEASPEEVPALLGAADVGLAFRRPSFSQRAVAPIKVAEYLLCGLPVAYSSGVGDLDIQLDGAVSVAIERTDANEAERVARWFLEEVLPERERHALAARRLGVEQFSLEAGAEGYRRAFALARQA